LENDSPRGAEAGLTETEAQEVVQETLITVAKKIDHLKYDPAIGSFKGWLLNITRWRIADQFRKRNRAGEQLARTRRDEGEETATIERIADPAGFDLDAAWDEEWHRNLLQAATERVKKKVSGKQYQIFDCYVLKEWPVQKVAKELRVSVAQVYLAKHRLSALLKKELGRVERAR
jgi:RNA polymerase sigma-70 factor (ECF subfamily)